MFVVMLYCGAKCTWGLKLCCSRKVIHRLVYLTLHFPVCVTYTVHKFVNFGLTTSKLALALARVSSR